MIPSQRLPPMNELRNGPPARLVGLTALAFSALYLRILPAGPRSR
jgi:hypothetical protein